MSTSKVKITLTGPGCGSVEVDGQRLPSVVALHVRASVGNINRVTLSLLASEVEIQGEMDVTTLAHSARERVKARP